MNTKIYVGILSISVFTASVAGYISYLNINTNIGADSILQAQQSQEIGIPIELASGDIISADEWNKIRNSLIALDNRTGEINLGNDGKMGIGLHGEEPEEDLHIKGTTYANADILLEDGETPPHKWNIGAGEIFAISKQEGEGEDGLIDGITIDHETRFVGLRQHDPRVPVHILKGDEDEGVKYNQAKKKTVIVENIFDDNSDEDTQENEKENNHITFLTADKQAQTGLQFETSENDGWHGWLGFLNDTSHNKIQFFDEDSRERYLMMSAEGPKTLQETIPNSFFVNASGNAGMGTDKPFHKLHVYEVFKNIGLNITDPRFETKTSFVSETEQGDANIGIAVNNPSATSRIQFSDNNLQDAPTGFEGGSGLSPWDGVIQYVHGQDYFQMSPHGKQENHALTLNKEQFLGIGTDIADLAYKLHVIRYKRSPYGADILGMFEFASTGASAYVATNTNDPEKKSGYYAQLNRETKGLLEHDHKNKVFILEKTKAGFMSINPKGFFGIQHGKKEDEAKHQVHIRECYKMKSDGTEMTNEEAEAAGIECNESEQNVMAAIENNVGSKAYFGAGASEKVGIKFVPKNLEDEWKGLIEYDNGKNKLSFGTNSTNHQMDINEEGWVGINKEDPEHGVHFVPKDGIMKVEGQLGVNKEPSFDVDAPSVNGDSLCVGGTCISSWPEVKNYHGPHGASSDIRLKTDINLIPDALTKIMQINGVSYKWKDTEKRGEQIEIGVIAQDVESVFPELVTIDHDGFKAVLYSKLTAILVEGVKEQQLQIHILQESNNALEQRINDIEERLTAVEQ